MFVAIAIPIVVVGYTRPAGANTTIILLGVGAGLLAGLLAGLWVSHRDGEVWRGRQF